MNIKNKIFLLLVFLSSIARAQPTFKIIPLGVYGGADESNLSAYMVAPKGSDAYICLDAGTLHAGIAKAIANHIFNGEVGDILKKNIKAYFISHPHLDHVAGLIINSPDDIGPKNIYGLPFTLNVLRDNYFTWKNWANFGSDGDKPVLNKYHYTPLIPGVETKIDSTAMTVQAFVLSHGNPYQSTAFLVGYKDSYVLYLGDTGADEIEQANNLQLLWQRIAVLFPARQLKAIMIEVSFPDEQPVKSLFGHLTPHLLMNEMTVLSKLTGPNLVKGFPVIITHIKPLGTHEADIKRELAAQNVLGLNLIYPKQGKVLEF